MCITKIDTDDLREQLKVDFQITNKEKEIKKLNNEIEKNKIKISLLLDEIDELKGKPNRYSFSEEVFKGKLKERWSK